MAYVALYRKYRSQSFQEVIGQAHITTVLQNAIRSGRVAHAYLFTGPRGCGKTSTARLLARALNCIAFDAPTPEPCGTCDMCERIRAGSAIDVIEMDAASETGIDDVREKIIENAKYSTAEARFKVYIIDEVHDLSAKAFDSLLKTIEEPPPHVVFVLATTEAHKVPITIRSRCQRMDFRRGTLQDLLHNIERVLSAEGIAYEADAVASIARAAEGSFRDSLSLLEQALAFSDGDVTAAAVHAAIGSVGPEVLDDLVAAITSDDLAAVFQRAATLTEAGRDVKQVLVALQGHLRDLMVAAIAADPRSLPEVSQDRFAVLKRQAAAFPAARLLQMLEVLAAAERDVRFTNQHRILLERTLWSVLPGQLAQRTMVSQSVSAPAPPAPGPSVSPPARPASSVPPAPRHAPEPAPPAPPAPRTPHAASPEGPGAPARSSSRAAPAVSAAASAAAVSETPAARPAAGGGAVDVEVIRRLWPRVREGITDRSKAASAILGQERVLSYEGGVVTIGFPAKFQRDTADKPRARDLICDVLQGLLGVSGIGIRCEVLAEGSDDVSGGPDQHPLDLPDHPADAAAPAGRRERAGRSAAASAPAPPEDPEEAEQGRFFDEVVSVMDARPIGD